MHIRSELFDPLVCLLDVAAQLLVRRELRIAQPVVADHSLFVWIRDRAALQFSHRRERLFRAWLHAGEESIIEPHPAHVDREADLRIFEKVFLKSRPERIRIHARSLTPNSGRRLLFALGLRDIRLTSYFVFRLRYAEQPMVEPADDMLEPLDAVPRLT